MRRIVLCTIVGAFVLGLLGCSQRIGDFTLISTKNVDIGKKFKKVGRKTGEDSVGEFLFIPFGAPDMKAAVDNAIESADGDLLTNAVVDFKYFSVILFGSRTIEVTGDVWKLASAGDRGELYELRRGDDGWELVSPGGDIRKVDFAALR